MSSPSVSSILPQAEDLITRVASWVKPPFGWKSLDADIHQYGILAKDGQLWNLGHHAARCGEYDFVRWYFDHGGDVHGTDNIGRTIGHHASHEWNTEVLKSWLDHGGDVNAVDHDGWTIGHHAARFGSIRCLRVFKKHGGDLFTLDKEGFTLGDYAAMNGHNDCLNFHLDHGGDIFENARITAKWWRRGGVHRKIGEYFHETTTQKAEEFPSGKDVDDGIKKMLPHLIPNLVKIEKPEHFEHFMRHAYRIDPEGFHIFLAKCSAKAVDGDDRLLQILIKAMEAP